MDQEGDFALPLGSPIDQEGDFTSPSWTTHGPAPMHDERAAGPARDHASLDARKEAAVAKASEKRQRQRTLSARFNDQEAEAVRQLADGAGMPVASFLRLAALNQPAGRTALGREDAARVLRQLGDIAETLRAMQVSGVVPADDPNLTAAWRDLAEMRTACLQALGMRP